MSVESRKLVWQHCNLLHYFRGIACIVWLLLVSFPRPPRYLAALCRRVSQFPGKVSVSYESTVNMWYFYDRAHAANRLIHALHVSIEQLSYVIRYCTL